MLVVDDDEEPTDPQPFGPPHGPEDVTKRRCVGCGTELQPDDDAYRRGAVLILNAAFAGMLRGGVGRAQAAGIVDKIAKDSGIDLI